MVAQLRNSKAQVCSSEWLPARPADHSLPAGFALPPELAAVLSRAGALPLYSHQASAIAAALAGRSVVVSTPTASGKSVCFVAPLLHALSEDSRKGKEGRALILYPLKALANDQLDALRVLLRQAGHAADAAAASVPPALPPASIARLRRMAALRVATYDGDTPLEQREMIRKSASIILTNVDMLHVGILPHHRAWPPAFWRNMRFCVMDEAHVYSGVLGSHCALVMRRMLRIVAHYAGKLAFLCCSATVANPAAHVEALTGQAATSISESGAPAGPKAIILWRPPELQAGKDAGDAAAAPTRKSVYHEAGEVLAELVSAGLRPLVFVPARKLAEIVAGNARSILNDRGLPAAATGVESYRAGYSAAERRALEDRLRSGRACAVVSTSALELGIDVGELNATVHVGVPETASAQWQQAGRAGRRGGMSVAVVIAAERPLDAFYLAEPALLAQRKSESANVDPANPVLLEQHLPAAAHELALVAEDAALFGGTEAFDAAIAACVQERTLAFDQGIRAYRCPLPDGFAAKVSIRGGLSRVTFALHDQNKYEEGRPCEASLVEEVDAKMAVQRLHTGAIFRHRLETYCVTDLNMEERVARARLMADAPLVTEPKIQVAVAELGLLERRDVCAAQAWRGRVHVSARVTGFVRRDLVRNLQLEEKMFPPNFYPATELDTDGVWFAVPQECVVRLPAEGLQAALVGVRNLCVSLLPSFCSCDSGDVGATVVSLLLEESAGPSMLVYLYDTHGGVGLMSPLFAGLELLWRRALSILERCSCEAGCASCTQAGRGGAQAGNSKGDTRVILQGLLGAWMGEGGGSGGRQ